MVQSPNKRSITHFIGGVTLTELMIVVVVVGILAALAYPSYRQYAARAKRNEAKAALLQIATMQERFYLQNSVYTNDMTNLGFPVSGNYYTATGSYKISVNGADTNNYNAIADYQNNDDEYDVCRQFSIDGTLTKSSIPETDCWVRSR